MQYAHATTAYSVKVKSRDLTGNISDFSGGLDLIIDTQAQLLEMH